MVRAAVRVLGRRARREIERAVGEFRSGRRTACPLLDSGGACRIYSARPTACRVHGQAMIVSPATGEAITMMCGPLRQRCEEWGRQSGQAIPLLDTGRILAAIADNEYGPIGYLDDFLAETLGLTTEAPTCHS